MSEATTDPIPTPEAELGAIRQACEREGIPNLYDRPQDPRSSSPVLYQVFELMHRLTASNEQLAVARQQLDDSRTCCYRLSARAIDAEKMIAGMVKTEEDDAEPEVEEDPKDPLLERCRIAELHAVTLMREKEQLRCQLDAQGAQRPRITASMIDDLVEAGMKLGHPEDWVHNQKGLNGGSDIIATVKDVIAVVVDRCVHSLVDEAPEVEPVAIDSTLADAIEVAIGHLENLENLETHSWKKCYEGRSATHAVLRKAMEVK